MDVTGAYGAQSPEVFGQQHVVINMDFLMHIDHHMCPTVEQKLKYPQIWLAAIYALQDLQFRTLHLTLLLILTFLLVVTNGSYFQEKGEYFDRHLVRPCNESDF